MDAPTSTFPTWRSGRRPPETRASPAEMDVDLADTRKLGPRVPRAESFLSERIWSENWMSPFLTSGVYDA
jgi:hypothetical protein